jgi:competence protein ComEC
MITIHELPALRILIGLVAGILLYPGYGMLSGWTIIALIVVTLLIILAVYFLRVRYKIRYLPSLILIIPCVTIGILLTFFTDERNSLTHMNHFPEMAKKKSRIIAECLEAPKKGKSWQVLLKAEAIEDSLGEYRQLDGKFIIFSKSFERTPEPGDLVSVIAQLDEIRRNEVPYGFDYQKYLASKHIYKIAYIKDADLQIIKTSPIYHLKFMAYKVRNWCIERCKAILGRNEMADLASGLIFGYREEIDESTQKAFVETGSVHLLAVSGMHVALIYINILFFLKVIGFRWLVGEKKMILTAVMFIWAFTFIAGLSASIVRAALMLTILVVGKLFGRKGTGLNAVFSGAVLMITSQPFVIYDVGFQLSFSAVIGIILLQHKIKQTLPAPLSGQKTLASLISVTLAAQAGTLPLILYHFHQFPVYFLISGLVAVFISDWVIKIGLAVILVSTFSMPLAIYFGPLWEISTTALLKSVEWISKIPFGIVTKIYFSLSMALVLSVMLLLTYIHIQNRLRNYRTLMILGILLLFALEGWSLFNAAHRESTVRIQLQQKQVVIYRKGLIGTVAADYRLDSIFVMNKISGYITATRIKDIKYQALTENEIDNIPGEVKADLSLH